MIRTYDGRRIVIPNGEFFTNPVFVNTAFDQRRVEYDVGTATATTPAVDPPADALIHQRTRTFTEEPPNS